MSYKARINQGADELKKAANDLAVKEARYAVESKLAGVKLKQAQLEPALDFALSRVPFNVDEVIKIQQEVKQQEELQEAIENLLSTEFAD